MKEIQEKLIEEEMKEAYVDYAMSVITSRALPDVNDGLKPVHRRILYAMSKLGLQHNKPPRKSAYVVGRVLAELHPHGDSAVYDALARMAQDFSLRYPLVDGQGNWGCFTGDTKIKLLDGKVKSFEELCKEYKNKKFYVYSIDKNGEVVIGEARNPRITKKNVELIELTLDTGEKIRCTLDHKFLLKNLKYKEAKDLTEKDSLMAGYFKKSKKNNSLKEYLVIKNKDNYEFVHDIVDQYNLENKKYKEKDGSVRHHKDFDKLNNNPENIERLSWKEHTKIHNEHINELWKDEEFRKKQRDGVKNYLNNNPEAVEKNRKRLIERNKDKKFIKENSKRLKEIYKDKKIREELGRKIKEFYNRYPEARKKQSELSIEMWKNPKKREEILNKLSISMRDDKVREKISKGLKKIYKQKPEIIEKRIEKLKEFYKNNPQARKDISERSKKLWENSEYRMKFVNDNYNHFSEMSKKLWLDEEFKEEQSLKAKKQWENKEFREKVSRSVSKSNLERIKQDPELMKKLSLKATESHKENWKNVDYKNNIIKNKVLNYVNYLINKVGEKNITKETYEENKYNNCFPKFNNAIKYFSNVNEMVELAKEYNHKIINIKILSEKQDVYDITVKKYHNFLLDCGVFVHNSIDGDKQASMRYTEARLTRLSSELLSDIEKNTVKMNPNYDESSKEPVILPTKIPNLLVNGSSGIAVGMATNMPPHNMTEILDALIFQIDSPECNVDDLMKIVKGPDFPTGSLIMGRSGIKQAYTDGKGKLKVRSRTEIEETEKDKRIIITEIPYMVNKSLLIENIANLVRDKRVEGIRDLRDESDKKGMRIVVELKRGEDPEVIRNNLFKFSQLQVTFGINNLALVAGEPKLLNLKDMLYFFIEHRKRIVTRRTEYDLGNAEKRAHILLGLRTALENIDLVIKLIKGSDSPLIAKDLLIKNLRITKLQSEAILEMKLSRLTSLEQGKITREYNELLILIKELREILDSEERVLGIIKKECLEVKERYGDERRTEILDDEMEMEDEDLIEKEDVVVTVSHAGYVKRMKLDEYKEQKRGGKGIKAAGTREEDFVEDIFVSSTHDNILFFSDKGKVYWLKTYIIPEGSRYSKGKAIINLLHLEKEKINAMIPVKNFEGNLVMVTKKGIVKRVKLESFNKPRKKGIIAIKLNGDELVDVKLSDGEKEMIICSANGSAVRFKESDVRVMGRNSYGVRGIRLVEDKVIGMEIAKDSLLTITENGYGKRTKIDEYRIIKRGGKGVRNIKTSERNGKVVGVKTVRDGDEVMFVSEKGILIRTPVKGISEIGRNTQGVRLMKLGEKDKVKDLAKVLKKEEVEEN